MTMKLVGLTGGICSGKSEVTKYLLEKGYKVIDCDKISRLLYRRNDYLAGIYDEVILEKSDIDLIMTDGVFDKAKFSEYVFSKSRALMRLNKYSYGFILKEIKKELESLSDEKFVFIDAPTLIESGLIGDLKFDEVWVIYVDTETQISRLKVRNPEKSDNEIQHIIKSQLGNAGRGKFATYILDNNSTIEWLRLAVDEGLRYMERKYN